MLFDQKHFLIPSRAIPLFFVLISMSVSALIGTDFWIVPNQSRYFMLIRYFPIIIGCISIILSSIIFRRFNLLNCIFTAIKTNRYWALFFVIALPGSIYAKFILHKETTYLSQVLSLLLFFVGYAVLDMVPNKYLLLIQKWILSWFGLVSLLAIIKVILNIILNLKTEPATVLLLMQSFGLAFYGLTGSLKLLSILLLSVFSILTYKNVAILSLFILLMLFIVFPNTRGKITKTYLVIILIILFLMGIVGIGMYSAVESYFSSGHVDFRYQNIMYQLDVFLQSPIWGQFFTGETGIYFGRTELLGNIYVPTHNDWVDVMAQGGLIGSVLLMGGFLHFIIKLVKVSKNILQKDSYFFITIRWIMVFSTVFVITSSLNSILGSPSIAMIGWFVFALGHKLIDYIKWDYMSRVYDSV
ncbi:MAG: O-antigen ligase family protein [Anaerolineales bacterium]